MYTATKRVQNLRMMTPTTDAAPLAPAYAAGGSGVLAMLRRAFLSLYGHYHSFHSFGPPRLKYMGWVGVFGFTSFYFLRFTRDNPAPLDDIELRIVVLLMMLAMALPNQWPERLKKAYLPFTYVTLLVGLPFFNVFIGLERGGGIVAISNCFIAICFLTLLVDWRNLIAMLLIGVGAAVATFHALFPEASVPRDLVLQLPAYALIAFAGYLFKYSTEQVEQERKLAEQQRHNERRLAALGDTLGFMAHELNTPLATVRGCVTVLRHRYQAGGEDQADSKTVQLVQRTRDEIMQVMDRTERSAVYCQNLLARFVQSAKEAVPGAGAPVVTASSLLRSLTNEFPLDPSERRWVCVEVEADFRLNGRRDLLYLVFCTVTKNALQALRGVTAPRLAITAGTAYRDDQPEELYGWIRFEDNGHGVPPEVLEKLTNEPVTTRGDDGGSGMGLMFCRRVMESAGGALEVSSEPGKGTSVLMQFHLSRDPV